MPEESHKLQCRGLWIPIEILTLFQQGKITALETILCAFIEGLVRANGLGCWASDKHLAKKLNRTPKHVGDMIGHLRILKVLLCIGTVTIRNLKYRLLKTAWSPRLPEDKTDEELEKKYEKSLSKRLKAQVKVKLGEEPAKPKRNKGTFTSREIPGGNNQSSSRGNPDTTSRRIPESNSREIPGESKNTSYSPTKKKKTAEHTRSRESEAVNGLLPEETDHRSPEYRRAEQWSCRFYKAVRRYLMENNTGLKLPNTSKGPAEFLKLGQQQEADTIEAILSWYEQHIGEKYVHEAFCARTFRLKFVEIARDKNRRAKAEQQDKATSADTIRLWKLISHREPCPGSPGHFTYVDKKTEFDWPIVRIPQRLRGIVMAAVRDANGQAVHDVWELETLIDSSW